MALTKRAEFGGRCLRFINPSGQHVASITEDGHVGFVSCAMRETLPVESDNLRELAGELEFFRKSHPVATRVL